MLLAQIMYRLLPPILALAIFLGVGYFTREYYWPWFQEQFKESQEHSRKEMDKITKAKPKWADIKIDGSTINNMPKIDISTRRTGPRDNPIRQR